MKNPSKMWGLEPISIDERRAWSQQLLVDGTGQPTGELAAQLLRLFLDSPLAEWDAKEIAEELFLDLRHADVMLRQLCVLNLIEECPERDSYCRLTVNPWNRSLMAKVFAWHQAGAVGISRSSKSVNCTS